MVIGTNINPIAIFAPLIINEAAIFFLARTVRSWPCLIKRLVNPSIFIPSLKRWMCKTVIDCYWSIRGTPLVLLPGKVIINQISRDFCRLILFKKSKIKMNNSQHKVSKHKWINGQHSSGFGTNHKKHRQIGN